ncbi:MAG: TetR/AcrR family transcriptional regulator [Endozoicomonas sp.]|uniref:TetR/AcrR family transcriptional regulator n=1 Tax=Endozoicomonas sp. TaxID=1892382 RepID=UPI003D9B7B4E
MAKPKPDPVKTRTLILDAAASLIGSKGFRGLTMKQVAAEAGMAVGKIYKFFPDKSSLFIHLENRFSQGLLLLVEEQLTTQQEPVRKFKHLLNVIYQYFSENIGLVRISIDPPYIHSDFVGTELETIADQELAATMQVRLAVRNLIGDLSATNDQQPEEVLDQQVLFLLNQVTGLLLNSHSRNFPYMLGQDQLSETEQAGLISYQLELVASTLFHLHKAE